MKINGSALKHGISAEDILHAVAHRVFESDPDDDIPAKHFVLGFDASGRLLELAILTFDSGHELVIHAMKARRQFRNLLE